MREKICVQHTAIAAEETRVGIGHERVRLAGESVVLHDADQVHCGFVGCAPVQADLRIDDLQARLVHIGPVGECVGNQVLHRADLVRRRNGQ